MRKSLGRILLLLIFSYTGVFASTYTWKAYSSKNEAFVNEAIYLKYVCEFSDRGELYTIEFNPVTQNEQYSVELLSQTTKIADGRRINTYEYVAFVKEPMLAEFSFDVAMKKTNRDSIENTVLGRDNLEKEEFLVRVIKQKPLVVYIKETNSTLFGDFTLVAESDKPEIKAYEPYHMEIKIKGNGDFKELDPLEFKIDGVKVFNEKPLLDIELTKEGYVGEWSQKFAFVSDKDFEIPSVKIKYFDMKTQSIKELLAESVGVKVSAGFKKEELLDKESNEKTINFDFIYYVLTFIAGFLVSKIKFKRKKTADDKDESFTQKVKTSNSLNELSIILALKDSKKFNKLISEIESKNITSLNKAKKILEEEYR